MGFKVKLKSLLSFFKQDECKVKVIGRGGVEYHSNGRIMKIDGEMQMGPEYDIMLVKSDISKWCSPHDKTVVSEEERQKIICDIERKLKKIKILWR